MVRKITGIIFIFSILFLLENLNFCQRTTREGFLMKQSAYDIEKIVALFSLSANDITKRTDEWISDAQIAIGEIVGVADAQRNYDNTMYPFDQICSLSDAAIGCHLLHALEILHPDKGIRDAAHDSTLKIQSFIIDSIGNNKELYRAIKSYEQNLFLQEDLEKDQIYFVLETVRDFERSGLALPDEQLSHVSALNKRISEICADFARAIAQDNRTITVERQELAGMPEAFVAALQKNEKGLYIVGVDYPTYIPIMENCTVADTRKKLWTAFANRGYPQNDASLTELLATRDEKAKALGFESYAALDLDNQMVQTVSRATDFIADLHVQTEKKVEKELARLLSNVPDSVQLDVQGRVYPWDMAFLSNQYKKKHLSLDEELLREYFPMEHTIEQLLDIYRQFLSVEFQQVPVSGLWHEDVQAVYVYSKNKAELLGTLFLDLYPRDNKYSHAAHTTIIPGVKNAYEIIPDVSIVIANFPKSTQERPSLLSRNDVSTFFHEFGHAMHAILGQTKIASFSGTSTKTDFVELPSQMLEEWLFDREILKKVSSHYQTGQPLSDELIDRILESKNAFSGLFISRQAFLSRLALEYYAPGKEKDVYGIMKNLHQELRPHIHFDAQDHFYASFGHLPSYAAKYYGYMWSKVFALDIFAEIRKHGLLDPVIGRKYVQTILAQGGSKDPNELLQDFLGREPNNKAFLKDLGLQ